MDDYFRIHGNKSKSYKVLISTAVTIGVILGVCYMFTSDPSITSDYQQFLLQYNKYYSDSEYTYRLSVFKSNLNIINSINSSQSSYQLEINEFGDMTLEEFRSLYLSTYSSYESLLVQDLPSNDLPSSIDWRDLNSVTRVKDQKSCGSCWAFSAIGAIEGAWAISSKELVELSEQQLVDCSSDYGNLGCDGGYMNQAFDYVIDHGLAYGKDYEYEGYKKECREHKHSKPVNIRTYVNVGKNNSLQLQAAVAKQPVSVAVDGGSYVFMFYKSGTIDKGCGTELSHGVLVVGYGEDVHGMYWIIKNSWGRRWGQLGYAKIRRTQEINSEGMCGIAMDASYPLI